MLPTTPARGPTEDGSLMPLLISPMSAKGKGKFKTLPKSLDLSKIPTFVPQIASGAEELVWSPTLGTRPRRSGETYQQSTGALAEIPISFSPEDSPLRNMAYNSPNRYPFRDDRDPSDSPSTSHRRSDSILRTAPSQLKNTLSPLNSFVALSSRSRRDRNGRSDRHTDLEGTPFPNDVDQRTEMATLTQNRNGRHSASSQNATTGYPVRDLSRPTSPSGFRGPRYPSKQVRGVYTAAQSLAPRSVPDYGNMNQTGQGMYGAYPVPYQDQLGPSRPESSTASFNPFGARTTDPQIWSTNNFSPSSSGVLPNQMPNQMLQPVPHVPHMQAQAQSPSSMAQISDGEFSVPPQGLMDPLSYWNMLHQREVEIRTRLQNTNRAMTGQERHYIFLLGEARIAAAASQLPARNGMGVREWLRELGLTFASIWRRKPGDMELTPLVVARKRDFETAVEREIELAKREMEQRQSRSASGEACGYGLP